MPEDDILWQGTMIEPLDTLFTDDSRVAHGVSGVLGADAKPGWRTSMLIDFTPLLLGRTPPPPPRPLRGT